MRFARLCVVYLLAPQSPFAEGTVGAPHEPMAGVIQTVFNRALTAQERLETVPLPGFPLRIIEIRPAGEVGVAEAPGPQNGWNHVVLRVRTKSEIVVSMVWTRIPEEER